ncbi:hypothetical protein H0H87_000179 [Tephrocybe sp. NHM501043]|nr:hypothetical protein H0H87_000179 [Tephrocybe sp. NHM501043]
MADYVMTLDSDSEEYSLPKPVKASKVDTEDTSLNPEFVFDISGDPYVDIVGQSSQYGDLVKKGTKPDPISVNDIIARHRLTRKRKLDSRTEDEQSGSEDDDLFEEESLESSSEPGEDDEANVDTSGPSDDDDLDEEEEEDDSSDDGSEIETQAEKDRKAAFFDFEAGPSDTHDSFLTMNLSRPILKAITTLGFTKPTPIQAATIPVALLGKDIVGNAVTGSGKTAAFIIPILERLLYREKGKNAAATRCVILVPTRELAVQCFDVGMKLATHTDIRLCLVVGGLSVKSQEVALRSRPDVVIATPGRLIDHIHNSPSFTLETLDVLVLDEADRMLSDGFADELAEIVKSCPPSRQTMLFSATMTDSVDELVKMSLNKPVRLFVDPKRSTARGLVQEFVRVRAGKESERSALLVALCKRTFKSNVIVFLRSKQIAHQMRIVFSLLGMKCEELHGDLSQDQRLRALQLFRDSSVDYLMATDLASRGLDIKGVETVINYDMPGQLAQYLHRVGRTARAGKKGRSVTLVGEADRKMLKAAIKHGAGEDQLRKAEMELKKGENMIEHEAEIYSRPARTWFQTGKEKANAEAISKQQYEDGFSSSAKSQGKKVIDEDKPKRDKFAGLSRRAKRRKMIMEEDAELGDQKSINAAIRSAKKSARPAKIGIPDQRPSKAKTKSRSRKVTSRAGGAFERDFGGKVGQREGVRAKKSDAIGKKDDKDLVALISRLGGRDRLGLWNYSHGTKVWEVDVGLGDENTVTDIVGIAWSPDGQSIVIAHHPPLVTLHSLQDGAKRLALPFRPHPDSEFRSLVAIWWFREERLAKPSSIPDILRRNNVAAGTSLAILRTLPLLDTLQEDSQRLTATDLFAFQGTQTKPTNKALSPSIIDEWPTLPPDPLAASINAPLIGKSTDPLGGSKDEVDETNVNSLLVVADNCGSIHCFLDGTFPLGTITLGSNVFATSLFKDQTRPLFFAHPIASGKEITVTSLCPQIIHVPLLGKHHIRNMAKLSSTARELVWYCMRTVKELQMTWFGSETFSGARELGPNWIQALESKQKDQFGQEKPNALLDLTSLLVTGRATDALLDFLGSGDQMSERSIQKWESIMSEALVKLRDYSEKRVAPACQRLHIVLEELQGWAQLCHGQLYWLPGSLPRHVMNYLVSDRSYTGFASVVYFSTKVYYAVMTYIFTETSAANPASETAPQPRYDILEVNNYFISGLSSSSIDRWFTGPTPQFSLKDFGVDNGKPIFEVVEQAYNLAKDDNAWSEYVCTVPTFFKILTQLPEVDALPERRGAFRQEHK